MSVAVLLVAATAVPAQAIHFYRGPDNGCTPNDGELGAAGAAPAATVMVMHNTFNDTATGGPVTQIEAGESVRWQWDSAHCHSVQADDFYSGYHYPTTEPTSPRGVPGFFDYPVPVEDPTLAYTRVFDTPGTYTYVCEHHGLIGMQGVVIVE